VANATRALKVAGVLGLILLVFGAGWLAGLARMGRAVDPAALPEVERRFVDTMKGAALVGHFTVRGRDVREGPPDRYDIYSVEKVGDELWRFNAKIGEVGLTVPVVVRMQFVDDTPMIVMTNAGIPGLGEGFSARVLFDGEQYAGTWGHGERGGLMFGRIERGGAQP
jgi:hypothetical protein